MAAKSIVAYSVTVEDARTWFATKREARAFEQRHTGSGIEAEPAIAHTRADVVDALNYLESASSSDSGRSR